MRRINSSTASPNENGTGRAGWREGSLEQQIPTTHGTAEWFNHVQEEIARTIELSGAALNPNSYEQLAEAVLGTREVFYSGPIDSTVPFTCPGWSEADVVTIQPDNGGGIVPGFDTNVRRKRKLIRVVGGNLYLRNQAAGMGIAAIDITTQRDLLIGPTEFFEMFKGSSYWSMLSHQPLKPQVFSVGLANNGQPYDQNTEILYRASNGSSPFLRPRVTLVSPLDGRGNGWNPFSVPAGGGGPGGVGLSTTANNAIAVYPVNLPHGAVLQRIRVGVVSTGSTDGSWFLEAFQTAPNRSNPAEPTSRQTIFRTVAGAGPHVLDSNDAAPIAEPVDNINSYQSFRVVSPEDSSVGSAAIHWVELSWGDPGPRNY